MAPRWGIELWGAAEWRRQQLGVRFGRAHWLGIGAKWAPVNRLQGAGPSNWGARLAGRPAGCASLGRPPTCLNSPNERRSLLLAQCLKAAEH